MDGEIQFHHAKALETLCQSQWLGTISETLASHSSSFLAGEKLYILTSPEDVTAAYKNTTQLNFDQVVYDLSITFGVTNAAMDKAYRKPTVDDNSDFYKQQLHPGNRFDLLQSKFWHYIDKSIRTENLSSPYVLSSTLTEKTVSLQSWCQNILLNAGTQAFFGEKILGMDPDLMQNLLGFRPKKKLWYKCPRAKTMHAAKAKVTKTLRKWLQLPMSERSDAAWLIKTMEARQRAIGMDEQEIATILTMVYFVYEMPLP